MPREQFFLDEQEDTIHNNQIELKTAKDKRANWWYYHKFHVLGAIVVIALIATLVYSFVSKVSPDYTIGLITQQDYSSDVVEKLEQELKAYADDRNGDGQVVVQVNSYAVNQTDVQMQQANVVRLIGDATSFDTVLYLSGCRNRMTSSSPIPTEPRRKKAQRILKTCGSTGQTARR